jgi:hypothetical protein
LHGFGGQASREAYANVLDLSSGLWENELDCILTQFSSTGLIRSAWKELYFYLLVGLYMHCKGIIDKPTTGQRMNALADQGRLEECQWYIEMLIRIHQSRDIEYLQELFEIDFSLG